jgi:YidC/Oxa1 family membrane protein insertase
LDQRRFIAFLLIWIGVMLLLNRFVFPPQKPAPPVAGAAADGKDAPKVVAKDAEGKEVPVEQPSLAAPPAQAAAGPLPEVAANEVPTQFVTIGSLDMASDYRMLVTLTNGGAAVDRAEMASPRFRDQHDWSGYLGELRLKSVPAGGAQIQVVGAGTPAANAKAGNAAAPLEVGDVIVGIGEPQTMAVKTVDDLHKALSATEPGQQIVLQVRHGDGAAQARTVVLGRRPFAVVRPEIENYTMRNAPVPADFVDPPSFLTTITAIDNNPLPKKDAERLAGLLETGNWELTAHDETSATFRRVLPELKLEIVKRYVLAKSPADARDDPNFPAYDLTLEIELHNSGDAKRSLAYRLDGPTGMPLEGWWYAHKISQRWFSAAGLRDVAVRFAGSPELQIDCPKIVQGKVDPMGDGQALAYAGVDGQYFSAVLIPKIESLEDVWFDTTEAILVGPKPDPHVPSTYANVTCRLARKPIELAAGGSHKDSYRVFIGPKRPDLLSQYYPANDPNYSLKDLLYFGWPIFAAVARFMLWVLHSFYGIIGNYGIAIVLLTVCVRGLMFPISFRQTKNMARIQALKPEMDRINEKYKTDMQKKSAATQELYRKNKINPLGGCLPVFLQLPVFIGLYRALSVDVELRQSPLFGQAIRWCSNLAAPDMLWNWSGVMPDFVTSGQGLFGLGPYLNILPLITVSLFLVTQKMAMPEPTNEQAVVQQKMMKYMTMFMGLMFYKVASGLCLYFIASSLWGIAERKLLPKPAAAAGAASGGASPGKGATTKISSNGIGGGNRPEMFKRKK